MVTSIAAICGDKCATSYVMSKIVTRSVAGGSHNELAVLIVVVVAKPHAIWMLRNLLGANSDRSL